MCGWKINLVRVYYANINSKIVNDFEQYVTKGLVQGMHSRVCLASKNTIQFIEHPACVPRNSHGEGSDPMLQEYTKLVLYGQFKITAVMMCIIRLKQTSELCMRMLCYHCFSQRFFDRLQISKFAFMLHKTGVTQRAGWWICKMRRPIQKPVIVIFIVKLFRYHLLCKLHPPTAAL